MNGSAMKPKVLIKKIFAKLGLVKPEKQGRHALVGPVELAEMKRKFQIKFLKAKGLKPEHNLLDLGCGTLRGGIPLIDYLGKGNYCGVDVRPKVLKEAKVELKEAGLEHKAPVLMTTDEMTSSLKTEFDFVWAFSVLIHMNDKILTDTLQFISKRLKKGGVFYANVNIGKNAEMQWQGFPVVTRTEDFYRKKAGGFGLDMKHVGTLLSLGHNSGQANQDAQIMMKFTRSGS